MAWLLCTCGKWKKHTHKKGSGNFCVGAIEEIPARQALAAAEERAERYRKALEEIAKMGPETAQAVAHHEGQNRGRVFVASPGDWQMVARAALGVD